MATTTKKATSAKAAEPGKGNVKELPSDGGRDELQKVADENEEKGYDGSVARLEDEDGTPNENYSLETPQDAPTPENQRVHPDKNLR